MQTNNLGKRSTIDTLKSTPPVAVMLLVLIAVFSFMSPSYLSFSNLSNILLQSSALMILAFGQTMVILTSGTDLSLGAQVSLVSVFWVYLYKAGIPILLALVITLIAIVLIGCINGIIISKGKVQPFIATLGMQNILYSVALLITKGSSIYKANDLFRTITETKFLGFNLPVWITALMFILTYVLLKKTKFGIAVYSLGGNTEALHLAGVNTFWVRVKVYAYAALMAGVAGILTTCRVECGLPIVGFGWEFDAVAATLLGGTSLRMGRGGVTGTIFGVLMISIIKNGLNVAGISALYQNALIGSIVLTAIVIDALIRHHRDEEGA